MFRIWTQFRLTWIRETKGRYTMRQQILHTPEGVRDIYSKEYGKKHVIEEKLQKVFHLYGYHDVQTPTFEYYEVFGKEIGTTPANELYRFFDRDGNTLALRPDITPSIARVAVTAFDTTNLPIRLCYKGNTYINHSNYQGRLRENTQVGAELIGVDSVDADAEMIAMAVDSLKEVGLKEFQIHIGSVNFFESLIEETGFEKEDESRLRELISNRNYFGVEELLKEKQAKITVKTAFQILPELIGGKEILKEAKKIALNNRTIAAVKHLEEIYVLLEAYGVECHVTFDLSMSGTYGYYTGVIFRGYTYGTGDAIVKGGRYDQLLEKFGKKSPSIGFAIVIDELLNAFGRQKIKIPYECKNTFILYEEKRLSDAVKLARNFRENGKKTELVGKKNDVALEEYITHAKQNFCSSLLYLDAENQIQMINLRTGKKQYVEKK